MAQKSYVVKAAGVVPTLDEGISTLVLHGAQVPPSASKDWIEHALEMDLIEEGKQASGMDVLAGDGSELVLPVVPAPAVSSPGGGSRSAGNDGTSAPAKSASKADWVAWAAKVEGVDVDSEQGKALAEKSRDELADAYADRTPSA